MPATTTTKPSTAAGASFREAEAWRAVGAGWKQLHGNFKNLGVSFEWHDFTCDADLDWKRSFHPDSVEVCINLAGVGDVRCSEQTAEFADDTSGFYRHGDPGLTAWRRAGQPHRFITIEFHPGFLRTHLADHRKDLHPVVRSAMDGEKASGISTIERIGGDLQQLVQSLRHPPVSAVAQRLWFHSKALEVASLLFFQTTNEQEFFCHRQQRLAQDRVSRVIALLKENLAEPPPLEEIAKRVGCSPFYLSRTFTKEAGMTISQYQRKLRLERAAELLKAGRHNVTEAAMEVGYSSISHFSQAFHEMFKCCPGLYPLGAQKK